MNYIRMTLLATLLVTMTQAQALSPIKTAVVATFAGLYGLSIHQAATSKNETRKKLGIAGTAVGSFILGYAFNNNPPDGGNGLSYTTQPSCVCSYLSRLANVFLCKKSGVLVYA